MQPRISSQSFISTDSPFPLADSSSSPTFCCSLYTCSSHGFSSLQSPSDFPSFLSDDSSQQIDAFQPLSLDSAELCCHHLHRCSCEASLDITQDDSVSQSKSNVSLFLRKPVFHGIEAQKFVLPHQSFPEKTSIQDFDSAVQEELGLDCAQLERVFQETNSAEASISLLSSLPLLQDTIKNRAALPIKDRENKKEQVISPAFVGESDSPFLSSAPDVAELSGLLTTNNSNDVYCENGYDFHSQINENRSLESQKTHAQIDNTTYIDAHNRYSCLHSSGTLLHEDVSSVLTSSKQDIATSIPKNGGADDKEDFIVHMDGNRVLRVRRLDNLVLPRPIESKFECTKEANQAALQEVHECNTVQRTQLLDNHVLPRPVEQKFECTREANQAALQEAHVRKKATDATCKERIINPSAILQSVKENISPQAFKQSQKRAGGLMTDPSGWMCPRDAKKNFKPKPRQILLDKWLAKQR